MRLGTDTGSSVNWMMGNSKSQEPHVGMGCTFLSWSDRDPGTVVAVFRSKAGVVNRLHVQEDTATRTDDRGYFTESQDYAFKPNPRAPIQTLKLGRDGRWRTPGGKAWGRVVLIRHRDAYRDPSF